MAETTLIFDNTENNRDLFYATGVPLHDPHLYVEIGGKKYVFTSPLEAGRLKKSPHIDHVLDMTIYHERGLALMEKARTRKTKNRHALIVHALLKEKNVRNIVIPDMFNVPLADALRDLGYGVRTQTSLYPQREVKSAKEVAHIKDAIERTEEAIWRAYGVLSDATIQKSGILMYRGKIVTAEMLKGIMGAYLIEHGYLAKDTIVAPGKQSVDPHQQGHGPIRAGKLIVIDIFPGSMEHGYFADISRTFIKGEPTPRQAAMYAAVLDAQESAQAAYAPKMTIKEVMAIAAKVLEDHGFETEHDIRKGPYGFIHGLSHGLGLAVHDPISQTDPLVAGNVISNEPGLYYAADGGVRLEDDLLITKSGCKNLCSFPKDNWIIA